MILSGTTMGLHQLYVLGIAFNYKERNQVAIRTKLKIVLPSEVVFTSYLDVSTLKLANSFTSR